MKRILLAFLLFASTARAAAPDAELDSLRDRLRQRIALHRRTPDDSLANACADLAEYWCYRSNDSSRFYAEKGLAANGGERGITALRLLNDLGVTALNDGDVRKAERLFREAAAAGERLAFAAPPLLREGPLEEDEVGRIAAALGIPRSAVRGHTWADNGPGWQVVELGSAEQVRALRPDAAALGARKVGVMGRHEGADGPRYEVRAFAPVGVEDPVTGSLNAGIAQWLTARDEAPERWTAAQGTVLGREGRIHLEREADGTIWVGGDTVVTIEGTIVV